MDEKRDIYKILENKGETEWVIASDKPLGLPEKKEEEVSLLGELKGMIPDELKDGKKLTPEEASKRAREFVESKGKLKEVIKKLSSKDSKTVDETMRYLESHQKVKRNAMRMANDMKASQDGTNKMGLNEKKKTQQLQNRAKAAMKEAKNRKVGQIDCVCVLMRGRIESSSIVLEELEDDKWSLVPIIIDTLKLIMICNATLLSGENKLATKLAGKKVFGPVSVLKIDDKDEPTFLEPSEFKQLLDACEISYK